MYWISSPPMDKVHLYLFDKYETLPDGFVAENLFLLPSARQAQCLRYRQAIDQQNCVIAYLLLQQGLREQYGIVDQVTFAYGANGKPYLKDYPHIFFNISHCKYGVVCAIAGFEVGVDIQDVRPYDPAVARRVCSEDELRLLSKSEDPAQLFCRLWTARESYAKMLGCGIAEVLKKDIPAEGVFCLEANQYCLALRCKSNHFELQMNKLHGL
jgi:4'-phosphopantetheinyl transferase